MAEDVKNKKSREKREGDLAGVSRWKLITHAVKSVYGDFALLPSFESAKSTIGV
jgi:hypothetical protein